MSKDDKKKDKKGKKDRATEQTADVALSALADSADPAAVGSTVAGSNGASDYGGIMQEALAMNEELVSLRRYYHMHPELSSQEFATARSIADYLRGLGNIEVHELVNGTAVLGLLRGGAGDGPTIMVRADIDALPIIEANTVEYKSQNVGVMHACGHDTHITGVLATARLLSQRAATLKGNVKFAFQPAEERSGGAQPMIDEGVMKNPSVDRVIGYHVWGDMRVGKVGISAGPVMAGVEEFVITIKGKGGHGAHPDQTVDPIVVAAHLITALQTIVSRNVDPLDTAICTVGKVEAGTAFNIIPETAKLTGTLRFFKEHVHELLLERVRTLAEGVAAGFGATAEVKYTGDLAMIPVDNDAETTAWLRGVAERTVGAERVVDQGQTMGGDDMALFVKQAHGTYFFLGGKNEAKGFDSPHHSSTFDIDEGCLPYGVAVLTAGVLDYLKLAALAVSTCIS